VGSGESPDELGRLAERYLRDLVAARWGSSPTRDRSSRQPTAATGRMAWPPRSWPRSRRIKASTPTAAIRRGRTSRHRAAGVVVVRDRGVVGHGGARLPAGEISTEVESRRDSPFALPRIVLPPTRPPVETYGWRQSAAEQLSNFLGVSLGL